MTKRTLGLSVLGATMAWSAVAAAIDSEAARAVVEGRLGAVRSCVTAGAEGTHGGITLTVYLSGDGSPRQVDVTRRGPGIEAEVARCAATALREASFEGGGRADIITVRLLVAETGSASERVRVRDVVVTGEGRGSGGSGSGGGVP